MNFFPYFLNVFGGLFWVKLLLCNLAEPSIKSQNASTSVDICPITRGALAVLFPRVAKFLTVNSSAPAGGPRGWRNGTLGRTVTTGFL